MHVDVLNEIDRSLRHFKTSFQRQTGHSVEPPRVELVVSKAHRSKIVHHVGEQQNIGEKIQIVIIAERELPISFLRRKRVPHCARMCVVLVADAAGLQAGVERFFRWQLRLLEPFK